MPEVLLEGSEAGNRPHLQLIATIIAAVAYGFIISLFFQTLALLIVNKKHSYTLTTRNTLIIYVLIMFALSTASAIQDFVFVTSTAFTAITTSSNIIKMNEPLVLPFTIFGADSFMLWRCVVLYQNASLLHRVVLYTALAFISIGSLGSAILYYMASHIATFASNSPLTPSIITISITTSLNFLLTAIIAGRLLYHQETMRRILGADYRSPYLRVIVMLVESCSLIVVTGIIFLALVARGDMKRLNGCVIPVLLLPHVCVASPLLIVYQVARGRAITRETVRFSQMPTPIVIGGDMGEDQSNLKSIQFYHPTSTIDIFEQDIAEVSELDCYIEPESDGTQSLDIHDKPSPISPV